MSLAARLKRFLNHYKVDYRLYNHERSLTLAQAVVRNNIPIQQVLEAIPLSDGIRKVLAVLPLNKTLEISALNRYFQTEFQILPASLSNQLFFDCESNCYPPFGEPYGLLIILDHSLASSSFATQNIYFNSGSGSSFVEMAFDDFIFLMGSTPSIAIAKEKENSESPESPEKSFQNLDFSPPQTLALPELPNIAKKILALTKNEDSGNLFSLISHNDVLSAEMFCYLKTHIAETSSKDLSSSSSFLNEENRVLDFSKVTHCALGFAASRAFQNCLNDFEIKQFWTHALYSAKLAQMLALQIPSLYEVSPQLSYSLGLFHNFGWILFAHLFPPEFRLLNKWKRQNPDLAIDILEKRILGMGQGIKVVPLGHAQLGAWLMEHWGMPEEFRTVSKEHHNFEYQGKYQNYICLIQLTNQLLHRLEVGDAGGQDSNTLNSKLLENLSLSLMTVEETFKSFKASLEPLREMVRILAS